MWRSNAIKQRSFVVCVFLVYFSCVCISIYFFRLCVFRFNQFYPRKFNGRRIRCSPILSILLIPYCRLCVWILVEPYLHITWNYIIASNRSQLPKEFHCDVRHFFCSSWNKNKRRNRRNLLGNEKSHNHHLTHSTRLMNLVSYEKTTDNFHFFEMSKCE